MDQGQRSCGSRSNKGSKQRQVGSRQRQVASFYRFQRFQVRDPPISWLYWKRVCLSRLLLFNHLMVNTLLNTYNLSMLVLLLTHPHTRNWFWSSLWHAKRPMSKIFSLLQSLLLPDWESSFGQKTCRPNLIYWDFNWMLKKNKEAGPLPVSQGRSKRVPSVRSRDISAFNLLALRQKLNTKLEQSRKKIAIVCEKGVLA